MVIHFTQISSKTLADCHEFYRKFMTYAEVENVRIENNEESRHSKVQYSINWEV